MAQREVTRLYKISDGELKQRGDALIICMTRDKDDFDTRNITKEDREAFRDMLNAFDDTPTDEEDLGEQSTATGVKDATAAQVRIALRPIRNIAELAFGRSGQYKRFGFNGMDKMDDADLHRLARRVVRVGRALLDKLSSKGLTKGMLDSLEELALQFDEEIDVAHDEQAQRHISAAARIVQGNAIWTKMVNFASVGKSLYEDKDEAKHAQYVLTDSDSSSSSPEPDEL